MERELWKEQNVVAGLAGLIWVILLRHGSEIIDSDLERLGLGEHVRVV